jgi:hypothetical protein
LFLLIKLPPETIKSKKKVGFIFHPYFYVQGSGAFLPPGSGIRIRDGAMVGSNHPGSATLMWHRAEL